AAKMPRAQSGRKCLAVHARQLALEPSLQILRRSRRPLLQRLEQAGRSALAHHVHWTPPMGARVLINGNWYYGGSPLGRAAPEDHVERQPKTQTIRCITLHMRIVSLQTRSKRT